ncbi:MAG: sodium:solute symporter family protein, partial [Candidatus Cardinium sp.]|nr:sodium:solute symporter family protein [Candidatus Cardinium sp.]
MIQSDLLIIGIFLFLTLAIGFYYGKGILTFQDYAVGNRKIASTAITLSLLATIYGGRAIYDTLNFYYDKGVSAYIRDLFLPVIYFIFSRFVIVRMHEFIGHLSIAESMGSLYGSAVRVITGILGIMVAIVALIVQIRISLEITSLLFPEITEISTYVIILSTLLWIGYTTVGGARSVAITDVYQFLLFGLCFPLLIFVFLYYAKGPLIKGQKIISIIHFQISKTHAQEMAKVLLYSCIISTGLFFNPACFHRFYMSASLTQACKVLNRSAIIRIFIPILFLMVLIALLAAGHTIQHNQNIIKYIIDCKYFPGLRAVLVTAIYALIMSTADSYLHIASVLSANDIWPVIAGLRKGSMQPSLKIARMASVLIGVVSLWAALCTATSSLTTLINKVHNLYGPIVGIPFFMTCLGFRPRTAVVLCSMGLTMVITIVHHIYYKGQDIPAYHMCIAMITSFLTLLSIHYILPKLPHTGWVGIQDRSAWDLQNQITKRWWLARVQQFIMLFTRSYRVSIFPTQERTFVAVGSYTILHAIIALCFIQRQYFLPYIYFYMLLMAIGTILALYPALYAYQKGGTPLLHNIWPMLLFFLLFIAPLQFAKLGQYSPMVCALLIASISLSIVLLSVECSSMLLFCALLIHKFLPPYVNFVDLFWESLKHASVIELVLAVMLVTAAVVGFVQYKYLRDKSVSKGKVMDITRSYEQRIALEAIYSQAHWARLDATAGGTLLREMGHALQETSEALYKQDPTGLRNEIACFNKKLQKFSDCLTWRAQEERSLKLNKKSIQSIPLESTILKVNQQILDLGEPLALLLRKQTDVAEIAVDPALLECLLLLNLWAISKSQQATDHTVTLTLTATTLQYGLGAEASANQMPLTLPALAFCFSTDTILPNLKPSYRITAMNANSTLPASEAQFYQLESKQIVEAHGGYIEIIESPTKVSCLYVFPIDGRKVMRFKTYDPTDLVANTLAETAESVAQEQELIELLTAQTTLKEERIQQTIAFIKKAHGLVRRKSGSPY